MTRATDAPLRIACVGAGPWGRHLIRNIHDLGALAWICEVDPARRAEFAARYPEAATAASIDAALADPEVAAVAIATPAATHGALVRQALAAGKDVFVEKPLCLSVAEGEELVAYARTHGRVLMVGHLLWYHPAVLKLKELVDEGALGRIQYVYSNRLNLGRIRREENILWSFAPHDISVILGLIGEQPEVVEARGGNYLHRRVADVTVSMLAFPSGVKAHIFASWLHPFKEQKLIVVGSQAMAVFDDLESRAKLRVYPHAIDWKGNVPIARRAESTIVEVESTEPLRSECEHFLQCIATRAEPRTGGEEALAVLRVLEACQRSLEASMDEELRPVRPTHIAPAPTIANPDAARPRPIHRPHPTEGEVATGSPAGTRSGTAPHVETSGASIPGVHAAGGTTSNEPDGSAAAPTDTLSPAKAPPRPYFVHESTYIDEDVEIGEGTRIWLFCHVLSHSRIGRNCRIGQNIVIGPRVTIGNGVKIQNNVTIGEGITIEDDVFIGPTVIFTNVRNPRGEIPRMSELQRTLVRRGATLGANCLILCGTTIGQYAFVAMGALVTRDVPDYALVMGQPARIVGWMCRCGHRIDFPSDDLPVTGACRVCGSLYRRDAEGVTAIAGEGAAVESPAFMASHEPADPPIPAGGKSASR